VWINVPTPSTITYETSVTAPVSGSISASQTWHPFGHVSCFGTNVPVSYSPGSRPGGSWEGWYAARAASFKQTARSDGSTESLTSDIGMLSLHHHHGRVAN